MAQCWPQPIDEALAQLLQPQRPGPIWAILCPSPNEPPACTLPDAPTLTSVASDVAGTSLTQEWKLTATPPSNDQNPWSAATWIGEYDEPLEGWKSLWTIRTKDGFGGGTGQTSAELGATGMKPGRKHRFAVAYCRYAGASGVWGCTGGGPDGTGFQNCTTVCTVTRPDVDDPDLMRGRVGSWGVWAHHHDHFVDSFEAGSLVP
jgi:hypothetical protein